MSRTLVRVLALTLSMAATACALETPGQPTPFDTASLAGTRWVLAGAAADGEGVRPTLRFADGGRVDGTSGCNNFTGKASMSGPSVRIGPLAGTRRMCADPAMQVESRFLKQLEAARGARMDGATLVLVDEAGASLVRLTRAQ
jgi:hypothetical protein